MNFSINKASLQVKVLNNDTYNNTLYLHIAVDTTRYILVIDYKNNIIYCNNMLIYEYNNILNKKYSFLIINTINYIFWLGITFKIDSNLNKLIKSLFNSL